MDRSLLPMVLLFAASVPALAEGLDALVPGTKYHATGDLPCHLAAFPQASQCPFGVVRSSGGAAEVEVTLPDGALRILEYDGRSFSSDKLRVSGRWDDHGVAHVSVGETERYEIPDIVVLGD